MSFPRVHSAESASGAQWLARLVLLPFAAVLALAASTSAQNSIWNGGTGFWTDNNWTGGVPTGSSAVFIDGGKTSIASIVTVDTNAAAASLTLDLNDALEIEGAQFTINTLTVNGAATLNGTVNIFPNGTLNLVSGGTLTGSINMSTGSPPFMGASPRFATLSGGTISGEGASIISGTGVINANLTDVSIVASGGNLFFNGTADTVGMYSQNVGSNLVLSGGSLLSSVFVSNGGTVTFAGGGVQDGVSITNGGTLQGYGFISPSLWSVTGTTLINANVSGATLNIASVGSGLTLPIEGATLGASNGGFLSVATPMIVAPSINIAAGSGMILHTPAITVSSSITNAGTLTLDSPTPGLPMSMQTTLTGSYVQEAGGNLFLDADSDALGPDLVVENGVVEFEGSNLIGIDVEDETFGCTSVLGLCHTYDLIDDIAEPIEGLGNITFDVSLLSPFSYQVVETPFDISLEIFGSLSGSGGGGGTGGGGGGSTTTPEPSSLLLLGSGLLAAAFAVRRGIRASADPCALQGSEISR